ncbi:hypothetical protein G4B88_000850 [Cannabis sativa]|uniref:Cobalamin-independent methionine synthase MetE N-terminal domain-containing protein n=1 Tax=Cannabis sativa TaxID=3483 RepID=A0A7J6DX51_CANSA|nr:hypothetical protein G4B88_000850 [Cannabis sativa]
MVLYHEPSQGHMLVNSTPQVGSVRCFRLQPLEAPNHLDVSNIREVSDHQEVFVDPSRDESLIFEILELKEEVGDDGSASWFLQDLASEQESEGCVIVYGFILKGLSNLFHINREVVAELKAAGATWIQFDEPTLVKDLDSHQLQAFTRAYSELESSLSGLNVIIESYFADVPAEAYKTLTSLKGVAGYGFDLVNETKLDAEIKSWLAFAAQKVVEVNALAKALNDQPRSVTCYQIALAIKDEVEDLEKAVVCMTSTHQGSHLQKKSLTGSIRCLLSWRLTFCKCRSF